MITCDQKALTGKLVFLLTCLTLTLASVIHASAQTPVTDYPCDPRSVANGGACPSGCSFAPVFEKGCNCFDNIDNDGDGRVDAADISDCAQYFGLSFVGPGTANCSITPPGGNPFAGIGAPVGSQQNTSDTQSKVVVGDVDNDGVPDAVITSKWGSEVRVVATNGPQADGSDEGDVKADYNLDGKKDDFPVFKGISPKNLLFEHEVLIADIDQAANGRGEIFTIVSNRGGNPKTPPTSFYLLALRYNSPGPGGLVPLYPPVPIGTDRPGIFGIADMDGDGKAELYLRDRIYAAETGALLASEGAKTNANTTLWDIDVTSAPVAVSVQGDSKMELICGTKIYSIPSLTNRNPASPASLTLFKDMNVDKPATRCFVKLMNDPDEYGVDTHSSTSVADIDRDGVIDVIITGALNSNAGRTAVFYWNVAKNTVDYVLTPSSAELGLAPADPNFANYSTGWIWGTGRVNVGDANGDGKSDLTFIGGNQLFCVTTNASDQLVTLWTNSLTATAKIPMGFRTINDSRSGVLTATIYDFDNNGQPEMVYRDSQSLNIIDGATGQNLLWSTICQSHTYTEGPVIADVNGDGATDICVTCNTSNAFNINQDIQQQALGQVRLYFSNGSTWLPTRKVWNQPGYFVVNINDDLTLPFPQLGQSTVFGTGNCANGLPGPQRPMNVFLNQVPFLNANGCPIFPAPDLTFTGDNPDTPGVDTNGDGVIEPKVVVTPPICGNLDITVQIRYGNIGDIPISDLVPVSFFRGDPRKPGATRLHNTTINITDLQVGSSILSNPIIFNGDGKEFKMYIALYNDGSVLPIASSGQTTKECTIFNNVDSVQVKPTPLITKIQKFDNAKCSIADVNNKGELRAHIFKTDPDTVFNILPYKFQWYNGVYNGVGTGSPISAAQGGKNSIITGLPAGDYTLLVTDTTKGCGADPKSITVKDSIIGPKLKILEQLDQTNCNPPNGKISVRVIGGNTGYNFSWLKDAVPFGTTTPVADGLIGKANYTVFAIDAGGNGCFADTTIFIDSKASPPIVDVDSIRNIVTCSNLTSGFIRGVALLSDNVTPDPDQSHYTFNWYFYSGTPATPIGSILPPANGTGAARTGLAAGRYVLNITDNISNCDSGPITETIADSTILPMAFIDETAPQTSCDPNNPNGVLTARVEVSGAPQNLNDFTFEWFKGDNTLPANIHNVVLDPPVGSVAGKVSGGGVFYTVKVTNKTTNCSDTEKRIILEDIHVPVITLTPTDNSICDPVLAGKNYNGGLTASVTFKGLPVSDFSGYEFKWFDGSQVTDPAIAVANNKDTFLGNLDGGYYTATVNLINLGCKSLPDTKEVKNLSAPPVLVMGAVGSTNCTTAPDGKALVASINAIAVPGPSGILAPFVFEWFNGNGTASPVAGATDGILEGRQGAVGAFFTVRVTDQSNGCRNTSFVEVPDARVIPLVSLGTTPNSICNAALTNPAQTFTGTATASVSNQVGAISNYTFAWTDNETNTALGAFTGAQLTQRDSSRYTVVTTHVVSGCVSAPVNAQVLNITSLPAVVMGAVGSTNCTTAPDGKALVASIDTTPVPSPSGILAPFVFEWFNGNGTASPIAGATDGILEGRQGAVGAFFTVRVTDQSNGCRNTGFVEVPDARVIPLISLGTTPNSICNAALTNPVQTFTGTVTASVSNQVGAISDYTFAWTDNETNTALGAFTGAQLTQRDSSRYTVVTTHVVSGCVSAPVNAQVLNITSLPAVVMGEVGSTNCTTAPDGKALVASIDTTPVPSPSGLLNPYAFEWFTGNTTAAPVPGATDGILEGRQGGVGAFFTMRVTNQSNGCQNTGSVEVTDKRVIPLVSLGTTPNSICNPALTNPVQTFSGTVTATITNQVGAISGYTFAWTDNETNIALGAFTGAQLTQRDSSRYTVVTTHVVSGCVSAPVNAQVLNITSLPAVVMGEVGSTNCTAAANGQALVASINTTPVPSPSGLLNPYAFEWFTGNTTAAPVPGATDGILEGRQGGVGAFFTVRVTNQSNGCQNTGSVEVPDERVIPLVSLGTTPNSICDPALTSPFKPFTGTATASVTNQIGVISDYTFAWTDNETNTALGAFTGPLLSERDSSRYTVVTTHVVSGCVSAPANTQVLNITSLPALEMSEVASTNCDPALPNGKALVAEIDNTPVPDPSGILAPYAFEWFSGNTTNTAITGAGTTDGILENRQGGIGSFFTARVTNQSNGCQNTSVVEISDNRSLPVVTLSTTDNKNCSAPFDGTAFVNTITYKTIVEGLGGYSFRWTHDNTILTSTASGLNKGTYELRVKRIDVGCESDPVQVDVDNDLYIPVINVATTNQTSCDLADPNGILSASMDETSFGGGAAVTGGYTFTWTNDGNPLTPGGTNVGNTSTVTDRTGNVFYTVTVERTSTRCANTQSVFLPELIKLPRLELVATDITDCSVPGFVTARVFIDNNNDGDANDAGDELSIAQINADYSLAWFRGNITGSLLAETDGVLNEISPGIKLPADSYSAIATNTFTQCKSSDFTDVVKGPGPLFNIFSEINKRPSSCGLDEGVVTAYVEDLGGVQQPFANYTFQWFEGSPTNGLSTPAPSFYTDPQVEFVLPVLNVDQNTISGGPIVGISGSPQAPDPGFLTGPTLYGRPSGTFSVVVTRDLDGCQEFKTLFLPYLTEPVIINTSITPDECIGDKGALDVDLNSPSPVANYQLRLFSGANPDLINDSPISSKPPVSTGGVAPNFTGEASFSNLASGIYTVLAQETFGNNCFSAPLLISLLESLPPVIDILGSSANTTCVISPFPGDGSLQIKINTDENDPFSASYPVPPPPTVIDKGIAPFVTYSVDVKDAGNVAVTGYPTASTFEDGDNETINGLRGEQYTITVTSSKGCATIKQYTIPDAPRVATLSGDVVVLPALACTPALEVNASVEIKNLGITGAAEICGNGLDDDGDGLIDSADPDCNDNLSDYQFDWFTDASLTLPSNILSAIGNSTIAKGGEILSNVGAPLPAPATVKITAGSYWVRATKVTAGVTGGVGCLSAPLKVDIEDESIKPTAVLTPKEDTSCELLAFFEGSINVKLTDPGSVDPTLFPAPFYNYNWTTSGVSTITDNPSDGDGAGTDDNFSNLSDGSYVLSITNNASGCIGFAQTTIIKAATPVLVANASHTDQMICNPDGSIQVDEIQVGGVIDPIYANFDFTWTRNTVTNIVVGPTPAADLLDINNLPTIGAGSYFVKVKKLPGITPGSGCESAPFRVDILDKSIDPSFTLTPFSNTACDANFEGSIELLVNNPGSAPTATYTYDWDEIQNPSDIESGAGSLPGDGTVAGINGNPVNLEDGTYFITVTNDVSGCFASGQTIITRQETPIVITRATPADQLICNPDGSIQVDEIQVGGFIDPIHANFDFTWTRNTVTNIVVGPTPAADLLDINNLPTIGAGSYFVKVKKLPGITPGSGCESAPFRVDILDKSIDPSFTLTPFSNTACDANFEGSIELLVNNPGSAPTATYTYDWDEIQNPSDIESGAGSLPGDGTVAGINGNPVNLEDGTYFITVTNDVSGCFASGQTIITRQETPIVITRATPADQLICNPDGSVQVDEIQVGGVIDPIHANFDFTWTRNTVTNIIVGPTPAADLLDINNLPTIGAGSYFVSVKKLPGITPGSGCESAPFRVDILDKSIDPSFTLTPFSNTACDANFEGSIELLVNNPGSAPTATYTYNWDESKNPIDIETVAGSVTSTLPSDGTGNHANDTPAGLQDGTYFITVTNDVSGCFASGQTIITRQETPIVITRATPADQLICNPDGSIQVDEIQVGGVIDPIHANFDFTWTRNTVTNIVVGPTPAADLLDINNLPTISAGSYFVKVKKLPGITPGSGCESAPFRVDILDKSIDPSFTLTPFSNTACDANFEGSIELLVNNPGSAPTATYTYNWDESKNPIDIETVAGSVTSTLPSDGTGNHANDTPASLQDGTYFITVTNDVSGCSASGQTIITRQETPIVITRATPADQMICNPDGSVQVDEIRVGGVIDPIHANFDFTWTRNIVTNIVVGPTPAADLLDINNLPTISAGSYFVKVKKLPGITPGSGCESAPFRVDILDKSVDPQIQFDPVVPNSSCDTDRPNAVIIANASERDATSDTYDFTWQLNNAALPGTLLPPVNTNTTSQLNNYPEGNYTLLVKNTITGCEFTAGVNVTIDLNVSLPNIITVLKNEPTTCIGDGQAEVTSISIGGKPALSGSDIDPPDFTYEWYNGSFIPDSLMVTNTPLLTPIKNGKYYVLVKDGITDCKSAPTEVELTDQDIDYPIIKLTLTTPQIKCDDDSAFGTGVLVSTAKEVGGLVENDDSSPDYTFEWFNNLDLNGAGFATTSTIDSLKEGDYSLLVKNLVTGCSKKAIYIVANDSARFLPELILSSFERTLCEGQDGMVLASVINRTDYPFKNSLDYQVDMYFGNKVNDPNLSTLVPERPNLAIVPTAPGSNTQNYTSGSNPPDRLAEGFYTVRVVDNNTGCITAKAEEIKDAREKPVVLIKEESPMVNCDITSANGQLFATADNNQIQGYTFDWHTGNTVPNTIPIDTLSRLIGQVAGDYVVRVTKIVTGCFTDEIGKINDARVLPPAPTALVIRDRTNCLVPNGWVTANVNGITIAHTFDWYDGSATKPVADFTGVNYFDRDIGPYSVTATDIITGCVSLPAIVTVKDARVLPVVSLTSTAALCLTPTGVVSLELINNQEVTLTDITWYDNVTNTQVGFGPEVYKLSAGSYTAEFITSESCEGTESIDIETEILSYNLVSVNGDDKNDVWIIDCLQYFPGNNVKVFNRSGIKVYEADGYDNSNVIFRGVGENGVYFLGDKLPDGTYFYIIDKRNGSKPITGYLELVR